MERRDIKTPADLIAWLELDEQHSHEREAIGWVYVTVDLEHGSHVHVVGVYPTPEAALIAAQHAYAEDEQIRDPGDVGWAHHVLPLFPDPSPQPEGGVMPNVQGGEVIPMLGVLGTVIYRARRLAARLFNR